MHLTLITAPAALPVTVAEAKAHLRVDHSIEDTLIENLIKVATAELDGRQGLLRRALITQTWDMQLLTFPFVQRIELPFPPLQSVTYIKYLDDDGVEQTLSTDVYEVVKTGEAAYIRRRRDQLWPVTFEDTDLGVTVRFVCGYGGTSASVPENIRAAMLLRIGELYNFRGDGDAPARGPGAAIDRLLAGSRRVVLR